MKPVIARFAPMGPCIAAVLMLSAPASAAPSLSVSGGVVSTDRDGVITVWANSPRSSLTIGNDASSFFRSKVRWLNVPAGAYLVTPEGVADGATMKAGSLSTTIAVPGGSQGVWRLESSPGQAYQFVVTGGGLGGLERAQSEAPNFSVHLGNAGGLSPLLKAIGGYEFPTYVLPGSRDRTKDFRSRVGESPQSFRIGEDRFIFLDNTSRRLGPSQHAWLRQELHKEAGRTFVFLHYPLIDPRRGKNVSMRDRSEVRGLLKLFQENRVTAVFAGHLPMVHQQAKLGVNYVIVGAGKAMRVDVRPDSVGYRAL